VRGGNVIVLPINFHYVSRQALPGPFEIRVGESGHADIRVPNNGTIAIGLGSWRPEYGDHRMDFAFWIPRTLAGQSSFVRLKLLEAGREIHRLDVALAIE
jgi:hypothetical protein